MTPKMRQNIARSNTLAFNSRNNKTKYKNKINKNKLEISRLQLSVTGLIK